TGSFVVASFADAFTSVTTGRALSVTNGIVTSASWALGSRAKRARTWMYRAVSLIGPGALIGLLQPVHVASGVPVPPVRTDSSTAPFARHDSVPNRARSVASSTLLVQTASGPPRPR